MNILVNLPDPYYRASAMRPIWRKLRPLGTVRFRSHDKQETFAKDAAWADAILMWSWPAPSPESLTGAPNLRFSGHIDLRQSSARALFDKGVAVSVVKKCWSPAVSELALGLILASLRRTSNHHLAMWQGREKWLGVRDLPVQDPHERQLTGLSVGIVGFGAIGRRLAEFLAPFQVKLLVHDPFILPDVIATAGGTPVTISQMMRQAEVVVLAAAANSGTKHLIGAREIRAMRPGAVLVNTARAALVDQNALIKRLQGGNFYAALDVFDPEPLPKNSPLRRLPNAYLTPHRAGGILESVQRAATMLVEELLAFSENRPRAHALTPAMVSSLDG